MPLFQGLMEKTQEGYTNFLSKSLPVKHISTRSSIAGLGLTVDIYKVEELDLNSIDQYHFDRWDMVLIMQPYFRLVLFGPNDLYKPTNIGYRSNISRWL